MCRGITGTYHAKVFQDALSVSRGRTPCPVAEEELSVIGIRTRKSVYQHEIKDQYLLPDGDST